MGADRRAHPPRDLPRLIVQHTPKCAGSSLKRALVRAYGHRQGFFDVEDGILDPQSLFARDRERYFAEARAIHPTQPLVIGHFPIAKYHHLEGLRVGTLRHPVDRCISHYHWLQSDAPVRGSALKEIVQSLGLDLIDFARLPQISGFYRDFFFADARPEDFDVLIFSERLPHGLRRLSGLIRTELPVHYANVTADADPAAGLRARRAREDRRTVAALRRILADEISWFEAARQAPAAVWD
jgi:hypothetical protein